MFWRSVCSCESDYLKGQGVRKSEILLTLEVKERFRGAGVESGKMEYGSDGTVPEKS